MAILRQRLQRILSYKDTKENRSRVKRLLEENIRNLRIIDFSLRENERGKYLKSVTVEIYRKREQTNEESDRTDTAIQ